MHVLKQWNGMKVIILVGLPLSGKTTHAKDVTETMQIPLYETGTFVYKAVEESGLEATPENIVKIAGELKSKSDSYFTEKALEYAMEKEGDDAIIFMSGIKAQSEIDYLNNSVGKENLFIISFHASSATRHARLLNEDRKKESNARGSKGVEDLAMSNDKSRFDMRDNKELGYGLGRLIALAHYVINTENRLWPNNNYEITLNQFNSILSEIKNK